MKKRLTLALVVAALGFAACDGCNSPAPKPGPVSLSPEDEKGWPAELYYSNLPYSEAELRRMSTDGNAAGFNLEAPNVLKKHYDQIGPTAHGAAGGTDVYWVKEKGVFFLRSDCQGHHVDGFIGPVKGDPRELLKPPFEPKPVVNPEQRAPDGGRLPG